MRQSRAWHFLQCRNQKRDRRDLCSLEKECELLVQCLEAEYKDVIPRSFGRSGLILHAHSGRRRIGDVQYYLDQLASDRYRFARHLNGYCEWPVLGWCHESRNLSNLETCNSPTLRDWIHWWTAESWSYARGKAVETGNSRRSQNDMDRGSFTSCALSAGLWQRQHQRTGSAFRWKRTLVLRIYGYHWAHLGGRLRVAGTSCGTSSRSSCGFDLEATDDESLDCVAECANC